MKRGIFFTIATFPLYFIFIIFLIRDFSVYWLINLALAWILYQTVWWTSSTFLSIYQIVDFYREFISKKRKFDLEPIQKSEFNIDFIKEFNWCVYNYTLQASRVKFSKNSLNLVDTPLLIFHAVPIKNEVFSSSKAYLYGPGMFAIVCRTKNLNKHPFEKFLFYHELEHVNDNGLMNFRSLIRHRMRLIIHMLVLVSFINSLWTSLVYFFFLGICGFNLWLNPLAQRERVADLGALLKFDNAKDRTVIINLLDKVFAAQFSKSGAIMKRVFSERIWYLNLFKKELTTELASDDLKSFMLVNDSQFQIRDYESVFATLLLVVVSFFLNISSLLILKTLVASISLYLILFLIAFVISTKLYVRTTRYLSSKFTIENFYQPFRQADTFMGMTLKQIIEKKFQ